MYSLSKVRLTECVFLWFFCSLWTAISSIAWSSSARSQNKAPTASPRARGTSPSSLTTRGTSCWSTTSSTSTHLTTWPSTACCTRWPTSSSAPVSWVSPCPPATNIAQAVGAISIAYVTKTTATMMCTPQNAQHMVLVVVIININFNSYYYYNKQHLLVRREEKFQDRPSVSPSPRVSRD